MRNYLTIDVEDYFQVAAFAGIIAYRDWSNFQARVVKNTQIILKLLATKDTRATFFVLGWVAEQFPELLREIIAQGHDIGCHSYLHRLIYNLTPAEFHQDTKQAKTLIEDVIDRKIYCYRAPSYSITNRSLWALEILDDLGFRVDSSIFPIYHDRYGIPGAPDLPFKISGLDLTEFPLSTLPVCGQRLPVAGGGYFRFFPYWMTRRFLRRINKEKQAPFIFYLHPWELDPDQPRINGAGTISHIRHYLNLSRTRERFSKLLTDFQFRPLPTPEESQKTISTEISREALQ